MDRRAWSLYCRGIAMLMLSALLNGCGDSQSHASPRASSAAAAISYPQGDWRSPLTFRS